MTSICLCGVPHLSNGCQAFLLNHPHYLGGDMLHLFWDGTPLFCLCHLACNSFPATASRPTSYLFKPPMHMVPSLAYSQHTFTSVISIITIIVTAIIPPTSKHNSSTFTFCFTTPRRNMVCTHLPPSPSHILFFYRWRAFIVKLVSVNALCSRIHLSR
ncbi:hypothetical protein Naga_100086g27 [Nannochloropsis gaditana]|uniref:Uncharacterized protein n=1 Tax=Nannochloropsis gaditana TaxID=72520 RepID=W7TDA1_9STRA|nr:hypothetical protein Naga_100086g27 [Nannochloropsis gaditana]